jgi:hypothetical protein
MLDPILVTTVKHLDQVGRLSRTIVPVELANLVVAVE